MHIPTLNHLRKTLASSVLLVAIVILAACSKAPERAGTAERQPISITSSPSPSFPALAQSTVSPNRQVAAVAPKPDEVTSAVARVFDKSAMFDQSHSPAFVVGDFNGDGAEDLAVVIKPSDQGLAAINDSLANWTLEDPREVPLPGAETANQPPKSKPVKAQKTDVLLAIIHGIGPQGWRNPDARQTYVLRNAADITATIRVNNKSVSGVSLHGDAISETIDGHRGMIFSTGARYAWTPEQ